MLKTFYVFLMLLFWVFLSLAAGQIAVHFMPPASLVWYASLSKPVWTAPDFVFPLVWTIMYVLMGLSAFWVWRNKKAGYKAALGLWVLQWIFNALWTPVFFGAQNIVAGFAVIVLLWIILLITVIKFFRQSRLSGILISLYFLWVSYAAVLTGVIWGMNR